MHVISRPQSYLFSSCLKLVLLVSNGILLPVQENGLGKYDVTNDHPGSSWVIKEGIHNVEDKIQAYLMRGI